MKRIIFVSVLTLFCIVSGLTHAPAAEENTLTLNFIQRIRVIGMLPKESDLQTLLTVRKIRNKVMATDEEKEKYDIADTPRGGIAWDVSKVKDMEPITIKIDEAEIKMLKDASKKLDKEKKIQSDNDTIDLHKVIGDL